MFQILSGLTLTIILVVFGTNFYGNAAHAFEEKQKGKCTPQASFVELHKDTIVYCGRTSRVLTEALENISDLSSAKYFVITSPGGKIESAIFISNFIEKHDLELKIKDYCLSACAHFIFLTNATAQIERGTLIAFHQTAFGVLNLMLESELLENKDQLAYATSKAIVEYEFFQKHGLENQILIEPLYRIFPLCVEDLKVAENGQIYGHSLSARHTFWVPSKLQLNNLFNLQSPAWWPTSQDEVDSLAFEKFSRNPGSYLFDGGYSEQWVSNDNYTIGYCAE